MKSAYPLLNPNSCMEWMWELCSVASQIQSMHICSVHGPLVWLHFVSHLASGRRSHALTLCTSWCFIFFYLSFVLLGSPSLIALTAFPLKTKPAAWTILTLLVEVKLFYQDFNFLQHSYEPQLGNWVCCKPGLDDDTDRIRLIAQHIIQLESF